MKRGESSQSESLWGDFASPETAEAATIPDIPDIPKAMSDAPELAAAPGAVPDWALPAWDAIDSSLPEQSLSAGSPAQLAPPVTAAAVPTAKPGSDQFALRILGVSEVNRAVRDAMRSDPNLRDVWVEGEVGRVTVSSAGHAYFTLKDERSQLSCVFFRDDRLASPFEPRTGLRVVAHGRVDLFESQGVYQLYVTAIQPAGIGDLALRFEALKARLAAEGISTPPASGG